MKNPSRAVLIRMARAICSTLTGAGCKLTVKELWFSIELARAAYHAEHQRNRRKA